MKTNFLLKTFLLVVLTGLSMSVRAQTDTNLTAAIELVRATYHLDREAYVAEKLAFSDAEGAKFWPVYKSYRAETDKIGDELIKLVLEYADQHPNVPEDRAAKLLKKYLKLEDQLGDVREKYFNRAAKAIPASKAMRWAQLENRMDLALRLQLAGQIPVIGNKQ